MTYDLNLSNCSFLSSYYVNTSLSVVTQFVSRQFLKTYFKGCITLLLYTKSVWWSYSQNCDKCTSVVITGVTFSLHFAGYLAYLVSTLNEH